MGETGTYEGDRRVGPRRKALLFGTMQFANGTTTRTCHIRNLSERGARLELDQAGWVDQRFHLVTATGHRSSRVAEVVWRSPDAIGVHFLDDAQHADLEQEVLRLRAERDLLKMRIRELTDEV